MEIKFYNTYLPLVSQDQEVIIPVTNSDLNISFKVETCNDLFIIDDYSCLLVKENMSVKALLEDLPQNFNILQDYLKKNLATFDDLSCLYALSLLQVVNNRKNASAIQTDIIYSMQNKSLGFAFLSGYTFVNSEKYFIQEGLLALPNHVTGVDVCSKILLFNEEKIQENYIEKVLTYNNQNIVICDSLELIDFYLNKQHLCCDEIICL